MNLGPREGRWSPCPTHETDGSTWYDETLLAQLMLLADSGFYFHLSQLVTSPEQCQYLQVLSVAGRDYKYLHPEPLGLPSFVSYVGVKEFVHELYDYESAHNFGVYRPYFETFQRDHARSGVFHHDPARWHAFAATRYLRFLATAPSG